MIRNLKFLIYLLILLSVSACAENAQSTSVPTALQKSPTTEPTASLPSPTTAFSNPTLVPPPWQERGVIPAEISPRMVEVYQRGLEMGNNPQAFSKIGDGNASADWFLADFDRSAGAYNLGEYGRLQTTIDYFAGSFARKNISAGRGFNTLIILDPSKADKKLCEAGETPLDCELRLHTPAFALILMGTNQVWRPDEFEQGMREILDTLIAHGVVPVLAAKADNLEGDGSINAIIASLADEYQAPLWNFWAALQPLPEHGLQKDLEHITWAGNDFSNPQNMQSGWPWRNLTALQMLDFLRMQMIMK